jgi:uncharacterized protein
MTTPQKNVVFVVVAKAPVAGKVKTRLCPPLSHEAAARLYTGFLRDTLELVQNELTGADVRIVCPTQADAEGIARIVPGVEFVVQNDEGLTEALTEAFASCLAVGFGKVFCLSSDNPTLPGAYLEEAIAALDSCDLVLGPSEDGGYYLVGAKAAYPALFENMIWSTDKVLDETIGRTRAAGLSYHLLPLWYDLDTGTDLSRFIKSLQNEPPKRARHTRHALQESEITL